MNIVITHEFPFEKKYYGGGNQIVKGLSGILAQKSHNVTILTSGSDEFKLNDNELGVKYIFLTKFSKISFIPYYFKILFFLLRKKPDYVISFTSESFIVTLFCRLFRINSSLYQAAPEFPNFTKFNYQFLFNIRFKLGIFLQFLGTKYTNHIYTISDYTTKMLKKEWGLDSKKISTLGLGLDDIILAKSKEKNLVKISNSSFNILSFGRITFNQKPFNRIVKPLSNLSNYWENWFIIGDGPDLDNLKNTIDSYNLTDKVTYTGSLQTAEIINYLKHCDIVILPSNYESFFITVYESLLFDKIVITDDVADIKLNLFEFSNLKIVNSKNIDNYQNMIEDVFINYDKYILNANKCSTFIRNSFNWDTIYDKINLK